MFKKISKKRLISYCVYFLLLSSLVSSSTLSKYVITEEGVGSLSLSNYVIESEFVDTASNTTVLYIGDMSPGEERSYTFSVRNYSEVESSDLEDTIQVVCDVLQNYTIEVITTGNIPLSFSITQYVEEDEEDLEDLEADDSEEETNLLDNETITIDGEILDVKNKYITPEIELGYGGAISHDYILTIFWEEDCDLKYVGEVDKVSIVVNAWQVTAETEQ